MSRVALALAVLLLTATSLATAGEATPTAQDPVTQARTMELARKLRCLVCQNQTIADSEADLAKDLRQQIAEQVNAGRSDSEIIAFMTDRYGDFVLYKPPFKASTVMLWVGPAFLLVLAFAILYRTLRRHAGASEATALTEADRARARAVLEEHMEGESPK